MLPRRGRFQDLDLRSGDLLHVLDHDHGVIPVGHGVARIDRHRLRRDDEPFRPCLARSEGVDEPDGVAVHGSGMIEGRRKLRDHCFRRNAPQRIADRNRLPGERSADIRFFQRSIVLRDRLSERQVVEIFFLFEIL